MPRSNLNRLSTPPSHLESGLAFLESIQNPNGCWEDEVVWCPMLTAQYVIVAHITGQKISDDKRKGFLKYFEDWQLRDGSFGMHAESPGYLFVTVLSYVALRLLGVKKQAIRAKRAQQWIDSRGGPLAIPSWGKLWLALLNLYHWDGVNPIPPELWLMPDSSPVHPRRYYCHTRLIYLAIGVLYGQRFQHPVDSVVKDLRLELYGDQDYATINFAAHRNVLHADDTFVAPSAVVKGGYELCRMLDKVTPSAVRQKAVEHCIKRIEFEFKSTRHACISPVNGLLNCLAVWVHDKNHPDFKPGFEGVDYWLWGTPETGLRYNGARSQTWDTSFAVQAIFAGPHSDRMTSALKKAFEYYDEHQMKDENPDREYWYRDQRVGGWCFSDKHHQWPVSDCTGEAIEAVRLMAAPPVGRHLPRWRVQAAAEFLLSRQNNDGGWGSYERKRGNLLLEHLNPSEMFGNCMTERSYIECTASCIRGLVACAELIPAPEEKLKEAMDSAINNGAALLRRTQNADGSWAGFWGVNYTYGTLFGVQGLLDAGISQEDPAIQGAVRWLKSKQLLDGGWGESWQSCVDETYMPTRHSQVIMTSWALMTLLMAGDRDTTVIEPAIAILKERQLPNGDWPEEGVGGVFFNTAMHHYCLYKTYFPIWALGLYESAKKRGEL